MPLKQRIIGILKAVFGFALVFLAAIVFVRAISPAPILGFEDGLRVSYVGESATDRAAYRVMCEASDSTDKSKDADAQVSVKRAEQPKTQEELLRSYDEAVAKCREALERGR